MIDIKETIAVSDLNIVPPRLTLMKFFSFINFFSISEKSPSGPTIKLILWLFFKQLLIKSSWSRIVFSESINYNNNENKFNLKKYEDSLKENLTEKIIEDLLLYLQSISVNKSNASLKGNIGYTVKN